MEDGEGGKKVEVEVVAVTGQEQQGPGGLGRDSVQTGELVDREREKE